MGKPVWLAAALCDAVGGFDLDPCAATTDRRKARVKARVLLTADDDGLTARWLGRVFVNPPYARGLSDWIRKCLLESQRGCLVVALIPARPDTSYWHDLIAGKAHVFLLRGRLKFGDADNSAPFASAVVVWGGCSKSIERIAAALPDAWHVPCREPVSEARSVQSLENIA